jgi:hypothetical protein
MCKCNEPVTQQQQEDCVVQVCTGCGDIQVWPIVLCEELVDLTSQGRTCYMCGRDASRLVTPHSKYWVCSACYCVANGLD